VQQQLEQESRSPARSRLTRLVEEVEQTKRQQKEVAIRQEEKAKLQKMKWDELESYLGQQAAVVQEWRKLNWDVISLQRDAATSF
ncbi:uncharacterized protein HaLaN_26457, partial [Haematococcus lacustris]